MPKSSRHRSRYLAYAVCVLVLIAALIVALRLFLGESPEQTLVNRYGADITQIDGILEVSLATSEIEDLSNAAPLLNGLGIVASLDVSLCPELKSLAGIGQLTSLETFSAANCANLASIDGIEFLSKLRTLVLSNCTTLSGTISIPESPTLQNLYIENCPKIEKLSLTATPSLQQLFLGGDIRLAEIEGLAGLKQLTDLDVSTCHRLGKLDGIDSLENLLMLDLRNCVALSSLDFLKSPSPIEILRLGGREDFHDLSTLSGLGNLRELHVDACRDLESLTGLSSTQLTYAGFSHCPNLRSTKGLGSVPKLEQLALSHCENLTDIAELAKLKQLQNLDLAHCTALKDVTPLSGLAQLQLIQLADTAVGAEDIKALKKALPETIIVEVADDTPPPY